MTEITLRPAKLSGTISAPASKSDGQRAVLCAVLATGTSRIKGLGQSDDELAMLEIARSLGRTVNLNGDITTISGELSVRDGLVLNAGESGLASRLITGVAAAFDKPVTITGDGSLLSRPMTFWEQTLPQFGVGIKSNNGFLPLTVHGSYKVEKGEADGSQSSQCISGLLMGLAFAGKGFHIRVRNLVSAAYLKMTVRTLQQFGITISNTNELYELRSRQRLQPADYKVESDWSSASFWLIAAALGHPIRVSGLSADSLQADVAVLKALTAAGCEVWKEDDTVRITPKRLTAFEFDATDCPDLFPILAVLATQCSGTTVLRGTNRLKHKESDRAAAIQQELEKMGAGIVLNDDEMQIAGPVALHGAWLESHSDHRMAMSLAIASTIANSPSELSGAKSVSKSYPQFWDEFQSKVAQP